MLITSSVQRQNMLARKIFVFGVIFVVKRMCSYFFHMNFHGSLSRESINISMSMADIATTVFLIHSLLMFDKHTFFGYVVLITRRLIIVLLYSRIELCKFTQFWTMFYCFVQFCEYVYIFKIRHTVRILCEWNNSRILEHTEHESKSKCIKN